MFDVMVPNLCTTREAAGRRRGKPGRRAKALHHHAVGIHDLGGEIGLVGGEHHLRRIKAGKPGPQTGAPAEKIGLVMREEVGDRAAVRLGRRRVEHHRNGLQEMVFFDHDAGHDGRSG